MKKKLRIGMIGHGFMGAAHSQGWRVAPHVFDLNFEIEMTQLAGRNADSASRAAAKLGWAESVSDWREVIQNDEIDIVDIVTPGESHAEIAIAALKAGKHVLCEKPLANTSEEAREMCETAKLAFIENRTISMLGFTYRRVPAVVQAHKMISEGRIGQVRQIRAEYAQDWLSDPQTPMSWRLDRKRAGHGALGDIGAHIIDLAEYLLSERLISVSGITETLVKERPINGISSQMGQVSVDDLAMFTGRFQSGVLGSFEASRFKTGRKNALSFEISGTKGSIHFNLENLNELNFYDSSANPEELGFRKILVTEPTHPYISNWWPAGHMLGYENAFSNQVFDFVTAISNEVPPSPSFEDGYHLQQALDAIAQSSDLSSQWVSIASQENFPRSERD